MKLAFGDLFFFRVNQSMETGKKYFYGIIRLREGGDREMMEGRRRDDGEGEERGRISEAPRCLRVQGAIGWS